MINRKPVDDETTQKIVDLLKKDEAFAQFPYLEELARRATILHCDQGSKVVKQGDPSDSFYLVISGHFRAIDTTQSPPRLLNYLLPGQFFGALGLLKGTPRSATVEAIIDSTVARFDRPTWDWLLIQNDRLENYFQTLEKHYQQQAERNFPGKQWDEVVVMMVKRDVMFLLARLVGPVVLLVMGFVVLLGEELLGQYYPDFLSSNLWLSIILPLLFIIPAILWGLYHYFDWRNDDFIVTTKRVIHIERVLFYGEQRDEVPLTRIQDVTVKTLDWIELFFDYHDLIIKTAGAGTLYMTGVPEAEKMRETIFDLRRKAKERVSAADLAAKRYKIAQRINLEGVLEKPAMSVAEAEAHIKPVAPIKQPKWSAVGYFIPRIQEIDYDENGSTQIIWRKHPFLLVSNVLPFLILTIILFWLTLTALIGIFPFSTANGWLGVIFGLMAVGALGTTLTRYDGWRRDLYIVTDRRIIDIEGTPFRLRGEKRREGTFDNIQNITYNIPNFFHKLLNMGDVIIETAGTQATFTFEKVYNPSGVQEEVFNRMVAFQQKEREKQRDATTEELVEMLAEYHHLLQKSQPPANKE